jgi:hypothetical protein
MFVTCAKWLTRLLGKLEVSEMRKRRAQTPEKLLIELGVMHGDRGG